MTSQDAVNIALQALDVAEVDWMLAGSLSSVHYGVPRSTKDADIVIDLKGASLQSVVKFLDSRFRFDRQMTFETVTGTTRQIVDVPEIPFRIEFFHLSKDVHDQERFRRRKSERLASFDRLVWLPTAEDVIVMKLRWALNASRGKDRDDVLNVIAVQAGNLDWEYIHRWCAVHGTRSLLDEIRSQIPDDL